MCILLFSITTVAGAIDWKQCKGESISLFLNKHTYTNSLLPEIDKFEALTGIDVSVFVLSEQQFFERQRIVLSTRSPEYDIMMIGPLFIWQYVPYLEPLNKYMNDHELTDIKAWDKEDFFSGLVESNQVDGNQYAIPVMAEVYILQYRKDLFDRFGLTVPKTPEEYLATGKKLKAAMEKAGIKNIDPVAIRGIRSPGAIAVGYSNIFHSYGAKDFDENGKCVINSKEGIYATDLYIELVKECASKDWPTYDWYDVKDAMTSGRAAVCHDCNFFAAEQWDPKVSRVVGKMAYSDVPSGPLGPVSNTWTWGLCINSASKHKKASWLFIQWATSEERLLKASVDYDNFDPTRASVWNNPKVASMLDGMGNYREVDTRTLNKARILFTPNPQILTLLDMWSVSLQEIWMGKKTVKKALDDLTKKVNKMNMLGK
jgi:ABC-type glycerol-3-phosphate transport system substrate-binding protein